MLKTLVARLFGRREPPIAQLLANIKTELHGDAPDEPVRINKREFFTFIAKNGERPASEIYREYARLALGPGKLSLEDYVGLRLFDHGGSGPDHKERFISDRLQWYLVSQVNDITYDALTHDKFFLYSILTQLGFRVPHTHAILTGSKRSFPGLAKIAAPEELVPTIAKLPMPLFFKLNKGLGSFGAFICDGVEGDRLNIRPDGEMSAHDLYEKKIRGRDFLIQEHVSNHESLKPLSGALATVRMTNFIVDGELITPIAIMKLGAAGSVADNFWREGSMLADIDPDTGTFRRVIRGSGLTLEVLSSHPESGISLPGFRVPYWKELVALNRECSVSFAPLPFNSLDIAITSDGPMIIEVNNGGSFLLPQLASGRGLLDPEIAAFFDLGLKQ